MVEWLGTIIGTLALTFLVLNEKINKLLDDLNTIVTRNYVTLIVLL